VGHDSLTNWTYFLRNHHPITLLLQIDPGALSAALLFGRERVTRLDLGMPFVPEAEVCYLRSISLTALQCVYLICAQKHTLFEVLSVSELTEDRLAHVERAFKCRLEKLRPPPPAQRRHGVLSLGILTNHAAVRVVSGSDAKGPLRIEQNASSTRRLPGPTEQSAFP
jgi:hypothetical protein